MFVQVLEAPPAQATSRRSPRHILMTCLSQFIAPHVKTQTTSNLRFDCHFLGLVQLKRGHMRAKIAVPIKSIQKLHLSPKSCQAADAVSAGWKGCLSYRRC